jgi:Icc-related predicted phosphoesterase
VSRRSVDVLLTHAPPRGCGDADDAPHRGFEALQGLVAAIAPQYLLHGHIHPHGSSQPDRELGGTRVRNVVGRHLLDIIPGAKG